MCRLSLLIAALALVSVLVLSACGRDTPTEDSTPLPTAAPTQPAALPSVTAVSPAVTLQPTEALRGPAPSPTIAEPAAPPSPTTRINGGPTPAAQISRRPGQEDLTTVEVVKILTPAVVQIVTQVLQMSMFNQPIPGEGVGTGVILDVEGRILTNNHVVQGAQVITVTLSNGQSFPARVVGTDLSTDLAVIQINAPGLTPAKLGNSSELQVGEDLVAIGHALGLKGGPTVSKGVVSALGRSIDSENRVTLVDLIQTDASINPGNSGGALANARAEVIGINTAIIAGGRGIGFAINIDDAKLVVAQLIDGRFVNRGFLGIRPFNLDPGFANQMGSPVEEGVIVAQVFPGTAAANAGLQIADIIVHLGDQPIANTGELSKFLLAHPPGDTVDIVFVRGTQILRSTLTLGER